MSERTLAQSKAAIVALAPAAFLAALLSHPHLPGRLPNAEAIAAAVVADPTRWALAHLAAGVGSGVLVLAFIVVYSHLRASAQVRWSGLGLGLVVVGSTMYALLPGMEFAPLTAAVTGADPVAAQEALGEWFLPVLLASALLFAAGVTGFVLDVVRAGLPTPSLAPLVAVAFAVMALSRVVPFASVQFYVQGGAALLAFWPLAHHIATTHRSLAGSAPPLVSTQGGRA